MIRHLNFKSEVKVTKSQLQNKKIHQGLDSLSYKYSSGHKIPNGFKTKSRSVLTHGSDPKLRQKLYCI